jgi:hypothetical protein
VTGSALLRLKDELDAGGFDGGTDAVGLVADDAVDLIGRNDLAGRCDHVKQKGTASDFVKDLGTLALKPRTLACGHDGDGESLCFHVRLSSHEDTAQQYPEAVPSPRTLCAQSIQKKKDSLVPPPLPVNRESPATVAGLSDFPDLRIAGSVKALRFQRSHG